MKKHTRRTAEELFTKAIEKIKSCGLAPATSLINNELIPLNNRLEQIYNQLKLKPAIHTNMMALITYDIEDNRIRRNIAKYLIRKGLIRLQKSVFFANLPRKKLFDIRDTLVKVNKLYENNDSIIILPIPDDYVNKINCIGKDVAIDIYLKNENTVFI